MENLDRYFGIFGMNDNHGRRRRDPRKRREVHRAFRIDKKRITHKSASRAAYVKRQWPMATTTCSCSPSPKTNAYSRASLSIQWEKPTRLCFLKAIPEAYPDTAKTVRHSSTVQGITQRRDCQWNCNPLTKGHLFLIEAAAKQVDFLFIIPVVEGDSGIFICRTDSP